MDFHPKTKPVFPGYVWDSLTFVLLQGDQVGFPASDHKVHVHCPLCPKPESDPGGLEPSAISWSPEISSPRVGSDSRSVQLCTWEERLFLSLRCLVLSSLRLPVLFLLLSWI